MFISRVICERWKTFLLVWVLLAIPAVAAILLLVTPTYTASGFVKVEPSTPILFPDVDAQLPAEAFDAFLSTQAREVSSSSVLNAALADPTLRNVSQAGTLDEVREALTVSVIPRTHLFRVSVTAKDPEAAIQITKAILRAYQGHTGGAAAKELGYKRSILEGERVRLGHELEQRRKDVYTLAQRYGANSATTIDALPESMAKSQEEAQKERYRAMAEEIELKEQLKHLDAGQVPTTMPGEDMTLREQMIQNDPTIRQLREVLASNVASVAQTGGTPANKEIGARTQDLLDKAVARVNAEADRRIAERHKLLLEDAKMRLSQKLESARRRVDFFQTVAAEREKTGLEAGQTVLEMRKLQDQLESIDRDYRIIDEAIGKLDIESRRPVRITVDDTAEVLPGDITDNRLRFGCFALAGAFVLALGGVLLAGERKCEATTSNEPPAGVRRELEHGES